MTNRIYKCPLCKSILTREKWIKITGQWEERQQLFESRKKEIEKIKKEQIERDKKHKKELKKIQKTALRTGIKKGIKKEKSERLRMIKMIQKQAKDLVASNKKIKELQQQLKEGKTPQTAGFDYEKEVQNILSEKFPEDKVQTTGKMGDVLQTVVVNKSRVGKILYECKKTERYSNRFVKGIKNHQEIAKADYAVVVTHAVKKDKTGFFIESDVIVIHPLCLLDIAFLLRNSLIEIHKLKLTKAEADQKGREILNYMQSGDFRKNMIDNLEKARAAYDILIKEVKNHTNDWNERLRLYSTIHKNTQEVRLAIGKIITGGALKQSDIESFPLTSEILPPQLKSGKRGDKND